MTDVRWTGREGEKIFSLLCSSNMVTCNKAEEDDRGWDFILNFPAGSILTVPIDQRSVGPTAIVQIKATRVDAQRWSISLKNALSLAMSPLPAFIVRVGLAEHGQNTFHAIHIWHAEIARILKAARQAHVDGDEATNHRSISFDFGNGNIRPDVLRWMVNEIDQISETRYAAAKQLLVDTLGFEDGHGIARVTFSTASPDAFTDLQLGIVEALDVDHFSYTPSRFGIIGSKPEIEMAGGTLSLVPTGRHATLRLRSPDGTQEFLPAEVFSANLPGSRQVKRRIKAGCIDIIIKPKGRISVKSALPHNRRTTLENIGAYSLLRRSPRTQPLMMSLRSDKAFVDLGKINMKLAPEPGWQQLLFITEALRKIIAFENAEPIETSIEAVDAQFAALSVLDALVADRAMRMEFTPIVEREGCIGAFLAHASVSFGGHQIGAVASRPIVADKMIGIRRRIDFGPATILHASVNDGRTGGIRDAYLDEVDRISERVDVLAIGDLQLNVSKDEDRPLIIDEPRRLPPRLLAN